MHYILMHLFVCKNMYMYINFSLYLIFIMDYMCLHIVFKLQLLILQRFFFLLYGLSTNKNKQNN
jgi:hypothetical protein